MNEIPQLLFKQQTNTFEVENTFKVKKGVKYSFVNEIISRSSYIGIESLYSVEKELC